MSGNCEECGIHVVDCRCQLRIDYDFIKRVMSPEYQKKVEEYRKEMIFKSNKWQREHPKEQNEHVRNYGKTEKGKITCKKRNAIRKQRFRELIKELTKEEMEQIQLFYLECPIGYEVDHIIPISKGGKHHISNLQYLTKQENRKKGAKLDFSN